MTKDELETAIRDYIGGDPDRYNDVAEIGAASLGFPHPVACVRWVPIEKICPNDYNPNTVAKIEMGLLLRSIRADGYTQPVVTFYDETRDKYVIVDGFHRYYTMKSNAALQGTTGARLPVVVIHKRIEERMASTVRHNRARGKHTVVGMANLVKQMTEEGLTDAQICNEIGMEPEELHRMKCMSGIAHLFKDAEYSQAWESIGQIIIRREHDAKNAPK